jgi:hypothetical protein
MFPAALCSRLVDRADTIKSSNAAFNEWHYTDRPYAPSGGSYELCEPQNVNWAMHQCVSVLSKANADLGNRALMARLLVHFIGDVHQPLHASSLFTPAFPGGDAGGNFIKLSPPAKVGTFTSSNLHSFWDAGGPSSGLEELGKSDVEGARLMAEVLDDAEAAAIAATPLTSVADIGELLDFMATESYQFAVNTTYSADLLAALGAGQVLDTTSLMWGKYAEATSQVCKQRLKLGGARLAQVLNSLYSTDMQLGRRVASKSVPHAR